MNSITLSRFRRKDGYRWRRVGGYVVPDPLDSDIEADRSCGRDLPRMMLPELRDELRRVEQAWAELGHRLHPDDWQRRWVEQRWQAVDRALARELVALGRTTGTP